MAVPISLLATVVSLVLAIQVARQYAARHQPYQLTWAVALFLFAIGTGAQFVAEVAGWSPFVYRIWYLSGAILTAAYLGQGTMYLLAKRKTAHIIMGVLLVATLYAVVRVFAAPVDLTQALAEGTISGAGMPQYVRILTPFFNIYGTLLLVGGAALSVWRYFRSGGSPYRAGGTVLIAVGSLAVASGGTLARFNVPQPLYVSELAGVLLIFVGFWLTGRRRPARQADSSQPARRT